MLKTKHKRLLTSHQNNETMKQEFKNENAKGISKARTSIYNALFYISTITTAICIAAVFVAMVYPKATIENAPYLCVISFLCALVIAHIIDFKINIRLGKMVIPEVIAWSTGRFNMSILRKTGAVLLACVWLFGVAASFVTSWGGSALAAGMASSFNAPMLNVVASAERKEVNKALQPHRDEITKIEGSILANTSANTSAEIKRLVKQKNEWAMVEANKIAAFWAQKGAKELQAAKNALSKTEARENLRADKIIADAENTSVKVTSQNENRTSIIWKFLTIIGTLPLIFGVLLVVSECADLVQIQLPKEVKQHPNGVGNGNVVGQRSGENERNEKRDALYTNP